MVDTINTTVDVTTHRLWGILAKKYGLSKIDMLRTLVAKNAKNSGLKVPKALEVFV
jgi:hypothetical protein